MTNKMIAYCGLICSDCPSLIATMANDVEALKKVAVMAQKEWGVEGATWETVQCTGCKGQGVRISYCSECKIRSCAESRGLETCGHCADYLNCNIIAQWFEQVSEAKTVLDEIHASLN